MTIVQSTSRKLPPIPLPPNAVANLKVPEVAWRTARVAAVKIIHARGIPEIKTHALVLTKALAALGIDVTPLEAPSVSSNLTAREMEVLREMSKGESNAEIGRVLFVSEDTVKTHARRLFRKLGARDRAHAVAEGFRRGWLA